MLDYALGQSLKSIAEQNHLRMEAMRLFEEALTKGDDTALIAFIERQLIQDPPRLQLLRDIADDLQQRLLALREHHFDVRERVITTLSESYAVDITRLAPSNQLEHYHQLALDDVMQYVATHGEALDADEIAILHKMVAVSLDMAGQLHTDIEMTAHIHHMVLDWLEGMASATMRHHWPTSNPTERKSDSKPRH